MEGWPWYLSALLQIPAAVFYYFLVILTVRFLGKRFAGQTTTFDLIVLITLGVVLQTVFLLPGRLQAILFFLSVLLTHKLFSMACNRFETFRICLRSPPTVLVKNGRVLHTALRREQLTYDDLLAGLRKLGFDSPKAVRRAVLEETGHITAVPIESPG